MECPACDVRVCLLPGASSAVNCADCETLFCYACGEKLNSSRPEVHYRVLPSVQPCAVTVPGGRTLRVGEDRQCIGSVVEGSSNQYMARNVSACCIFAMEALLQLSLGKDLSALLVDEILASGAGYDLEEHLFVDEVIAHVPRYASLHMLSQKLVEGYEELAEMLLEGATKAAGERSATNPLLSASVVLCGPECFMVAVIGDQFVLFDSHRRHDMTGAAFILPTDKAGLLTYLTQTFGEFGEVSGRQCEVSTFSPWLRVEEESECPPADFSVLKCRALLRTTATQQAHILELSRELVAAKDRFAALKLERDDLFDTVATLRQQAQVVARQGMPGNSSNKTGAAAKQKGQSKGSNHSKGKQGGSWRGKKGGGHFHHSNRGKKSKRNKSSPSQPQSGKASGQNHSNSAQSGKKEDGKQEANSNREQDREENQRIIDEERRQREEDATLRLVAELTRAEELVVEEEEDVEDGDNGHIYGEASWAVEEADDETLRLVAEIVRAREQEELDYALAQSLQPLTFECPVCADQCSYEDVFEVGDCGHQLCRDDARRMVETQVKDGHGEVFCVVCTTKPKTKMTHLQIQNLVAEETYERFLVLDRDLVLRDDRAMQCGAPDCSGIFLLSAEEGEVVVFECPLNPEHNYCMRCDSEDTHAGVTCDEYQQWREENENADELFEAAAGPGNYQPCPGCKVPIGRGEGCNHMQCPRCSCHFCNNCGQVLNATDPYSHYRRNECPMIDGQ